MILALTSDALTLRKLAAVAAEVESDLVEAVPLDEVDSGTTPTAVVLELEKADMTDLIGESKTRWPLTMVIGVLKLPSAELWKSAEDAACDLVTTRGALEKVVPGRLESWLKNPRGRRLRLFEIADVAGRLGVVLRLDDEATGPVAIYHIGGDLVAVQDLCPHAGALLSQGEVSVDDGVVTCPEHGSRFDTRSGERLRGPSDEGLRTYPIVVEDGQAYLQLEQA